MDRELARTVERILRDGEEGSLFIGKGRSLRQLVFAGDQLRLVDAGRQVSFCPTPALLDPSRLDRNRLDFLLARAVTNPSSLTASDEIIALLSEEELEQLAFEEYCQECLMLLEGSNGHWVFERGNLPEADKGERSIATSRFESEFKRRLGERQLVEKIFPSESELPVLSAQGIAARSVPEHWLFSRVADLVDGFRTVRRLRMDCPFPPHLTVKILVAAARQGWILKKRFTELLGIDLGEVSSDQLIPIASQLESATRMAVDPVPLLRKLVEIHKSLEDPAATAQQWIRIGDVQGGRRNGESALASYREALRIVPGHPGATERSARLLEEQAEEALACGDDARARSLLREGLPMRGADEARTLRILETYEDDRELAREATRIASRLHQQKDTEASTRLLDLAVARFSKNEALIRARINFLLDHGEVKRAVVELRNLATRLRVEGRVALARTIEAKIARVEGTVPADPPGEVSSGEVAADASNRPSASKARILVPLTIIAGVLALLVVVNGSSTELVARATALLASSRGEPGSSEMKEWDEAARRWLIEGTRLQSWLPPGPWRRQLDAMAIRLDGEVDEAIRDTLVTLGNLARDAAAARLLGETEVAEEKLREIERIGEGTPWQEWAVDRRGLWKEYEGEADRLAQEARRRRQVGDRSGAFEVLKSLLDRYPTSASASEITLPVELRSATGAVEIFRDGQSLGTTPLWIEVSPLERVNIEVRQENGSRHSLEISEPTRPSVTLSAPPQ